MVSHPAWYPITTWYPTRRGIWSAVRAAQQVVIPRPGDGLDVPGVGRAFIHFETLDGSSLAQVTGRVKRRARAPAVAGGLGGGGGYHVAGYR